MICPACNQGISAANICVAAAAGFRFVLDVIAIKLGLQHVDVCSLRSGVWHAERCQRSPGVSLPRFIELARPGVAAGAAFDLVIQQATSDSTAMDSEQRELSTADASGLRRARIVPAAPDAEADPCIAVARQLALAHRLPRYALFAMEAGRALLAVGDLRLGVLGFDRVLAVPDAAEAARNMGLCLEQLKSAAAVRLGDARAFEAIPLICLGDSAPRYVTSVADRAGFSQCLVPPSCALLPAMGLLLADIAIDVVHNILPATESLEDLRTAFAEAFETLGKLIMREGYDLDDTTCTRFASVQVEDTASSRLLEFVCDDLYAVQPVLEGIRSACMAAGLTAPDRLPLVGSIRVHAVIETAKPPLPAASPSAWNLSASRADAGSGRSAQPPTRKIAGPVEIADEWTEFRVDSGWTVERLPTNSLQIAKADGKS